MKATRKSYAKMTQMKRTRKPRKCSICERIIQIGQKYGLTSRGTIWCEDCK